MGQKNCPAPATCVTKISDDFDLLLNAVGKMISWFIYLFYLAFQNINMLNEEQEFYVEPNQQKYQKATVWFLKGHTDITFLS